MTIWEIKMRTTPADPWYWLRFTTCGEVETLQEIATRLNAAGMLAARDWQRVNTIIKRAKERRHDYELMVQNGVNVEILTTIYSGVYDIRGVQTTQPTMGRKAF